MGRDDDAQLRAAKRGYKEAAAEGNREEEARWANTIGDMLKTRGEYVEALRWLRLDYEVSVKCLPQKQILPTCQSLGEVLLRLNQHKDALVYQKKHLELAKESNDLIEQQRACTQLGRTYHEIFLKSEDDHYAIRNSKKYFKSAMKLAQKLKENHAGHKTSHFLKELIDAHNNIGMLELDLDNLDEAEKILLKGLKICDEEGVNESDDGRSRLHHNLGSVYLDLRKWGQAKEHIEKDILICKTIEHKQGESKGFINLGELHYRLQKYGEATKCYQKALEIAEVMEDEDALVDQITQNLKTVGEAMQVWEDLKIEDQKFRRLARITCNAKGTPQERGFLLEQNTSLDRLIEKSSMIFAWKKDLANTENARDVLSTCTAVNLEEKSCSFKSKYPKILSQNDTRFGSLSDMEDTNTPHSAASESKTEYPETSGSLHFGQSTGLNISNADIEIDITVKVGSLFIHVDKHSCLEGDKLNSDLLKVEVACLYYLQLAKDKQSKGLLPIIQNMKFLGRNMQMVESTGNLDLCLSGNIYIEAVINAWVPKRLMKLYVDYCEKSSEEPNLILLKKLYSLEVSEDEIIISGCGLQDISISPLVEALHEHKTIALLDVSHNLLGNETMEKLRKMFTSSSQTYGSLTLDLHCNHFGPTSLFQICECPVVLARLEVLNLSGNRLTDACCSYLSTILSNCRALYSLSIEQCSITSRTIQRISDVLDENHVLSQLNIGKNGPISGNSIIGLLTKLAKLKRFSDLSLTGIKLNKNGISSICELIGKSDLSSLMLGSTCIGSEGAVSITEALSSTSQELVKFDISYCGLIAKDFSRVCANAALGGGLHELNLEGNSLGMEGCDALGSLLRDPQCSLKILILNTGQLGLSGVVKLLQALEENISLEELHVADNAIVVQETTLPCEAAMHDSSSAENLTKSCEAIFSYRNMEVADSEDELTKEEATAAVGMGGSCITANLRNSKPLATCHAVQELSRAISSAKQLMLLDLSRNRFSVEDVGLLYASWSSRDGVSARKHLTGDTVHFFVEGKTCCGVRACCKREGTV